MVRKNLEKKKKKGISSYRYQNENGSCPEKAKS